MMDRKVGLVVSGGGAKGAFAVGALRYMIEERGMSFDMAAGTSTGSLIVPMILAGRLDVIVDIYRNVTTPEVVTQKCMPLALLGDSLFGVGPLKRLIDRNLTPEVWAKLEGERTTFVTTTDLQTGQNVFFRVGGARPRTLARLPSLRTNLTRETMVRAILASCCQPIFMPPIVVEPEKTPIEQHVDGGVRDVDPAQVLIDHGATDLYVIDLSSVNHPPEKTVYKDLLSIFARGLDLFTTEITKNDLDGAQLQFDAVRYLADIKHRLAHELPFDPRRIEEIIAAVPGNPFAKVCLQSYTLIQPVDPLPIENALEFEPKVMREVMDLGYARAKEVLSGRAETRLRAPVAAGELAPA